MPKFETKTPLFGYFWTGILKKTIIIFEIGLLEFCSKLNEKQINEYETSGRCFDC